MHKISRRASISTGREVPFWPKIADAADLSARFERVLHPAKCFIFKLWKRLSEKISPSTETPGTNYIFYLITQT